MSAPHRVLFLCTGNSARSQIAEAITNARFPDWQAFSAGVRPSGAVHPLALHVLREIGIEHHGEAKSVEVFRGMDFDLVVTLCDDANEECPAWLGKGRRVHRSFVDPARAEGTEEERLAAFRRVHDEIAEDLPQLLLGSPPDRQRMLPVAPRGGGSRRERLDPREDQRQVG